MASKKQIVGSKLLFMPKRFCALSKSDLVKAFFAYYYELIIEKDSNRETQLIIDYSEDNIFNDDFSNEILWKKLWYLYISYVADTIDFSSLVDITYKEITNIDGITNEELVDFLSMSDTCIRKYSNLREHMTNSFRFHAMFTARRSCIREAGYLSIQDKKMIATRIKPYIKKLKPRNEFLKNNEFFDPMQVVFDLVERAWYNRTDPLPNFEVVFMLLLENIFYPNESAINNISKELSCFLTEGEGDILGE